MSSQGAPETGWWPRNRRALLALPVVLALVAVSGLGRVLMFWLPHELTDRVETDAGSPVTFTDTYQDVNGTHERTVDLAVVRVTADAEPTTTTGDPALGEDLLPPGTRLWEVELVVDADPDTVLTGCVIQLVDETGRVTQRESNLLPWDAPFGGCEPTDTINPSAVLYEGFETEPSTRPPHYTHVAQLLTAEDFVPVEVRVWWEPPSYLAVPLPAAGR